MHSMIGLLPNVGPLELGILLVIVVLVFGPKRIPVAFRALTDGFRNFKEGASGKEKPEKLTESREADPVASKPKDKDGTRS